MKLKSFLIILILTVSSVYAMPPRTYYTPQYKTEEELLSRCRCYARMLGYDDSKIIEAHIITLPDDILGKMRLTDKGAIILINKNHKWLDWTEFDANIVHEVCHVYTNNDLEWHIAMSRAIEKIWILAFDLTRDEATDHPLD